MYQPIYPFVYRIPLSSIYLFIYIAIVNSSIYRSIYLSIYLSNYYPSICLSIIHIIFVNPSFHPSFSLSLSVYIHLTYIMFFLSNLAIHIFLFIPTEKVWKCPCLYTIFKVKFIRFFWTFVRVDLGTSWSHLPRIGRHQKHTVRVRLRQVSLSCASVASIWDGDILDLAPVRFLDEGTNATRCRQTICGEMENIGK